MELIKNHIHMNRITGSETLQITLDDDYMVPDSNPAVGKIIKESGSVKITSVKIRDGQVIVFGELDFKMLYLGDNSSMFYNYGGSIPFEESINMDNADEDDIVSVSSELDDLRVNIVNPVKLSVKAIVTLRAVCEAIRDEDVATDVISSDPVDYLKRPMDLVSIVVNKKDTYRIKDDMDIPANKPDMYRIIWDTIRIKSIHLKLLDGTISISGELGIFIMYLPDDDAAPIQWVDMPMSFAGSIELKEAEENMILNAAVNIQDSSVEIKTDMNGEQRVLSIECVLGLDIKVYKEERTEVLEQMYSPFKQLDCISEESKYESLLIKNSSGSKVSGKISAENNEGNILQVCGSEADIKIDETTIDGTGISVDGVIYASALYVSSDDKCPINCARGMLPFTNHIEVPGINSDSTYYLNPRIEQVSANMVSADEIEIRGNVIIDVTAFDNQSGQIITDVVERPLDMEIIRGLPGIVGYIVRDGDSLWSIAKENYTTVANIKEVNKLTTDNIKAGDKLVLVKQIAR